MATFYNQATLSFGRTVTSSNVTEGEVLGGVTLTKTAVTTDYGPGDGISYVITVTNNGATPVAGLTLTDNLGAYTLPGGTTEVTPLTYVEGSLLYYVDGVLTEAPEVVATDNLTIGGITVPAGGNATIIYEARANEFAPLGAASAITNTVTADGGVCDGELSDSATVNTRDEARLTIAKAICPAVITCSGEVTYTLIVQNTGNIPAVATDNVIIRDTFTPTLSNITVALNGEALEAGVGYTYNEETGEFATTEGAVPVPAATYSRDPVTGIVTTTPGVAVITVNGIIG